MGADEGLFRDGVNLIQRVPERFCQMKANPTILLSTLAFSRKLFLSVNSIYAFKETQALPFLTTSQAYSASEAISFVVAFVFS